MRRGRRRRTAARRCGLPRTGSRCSASPKRRSPAASIPKVTVYHAADCHLCERARAVVEGVRAEVPFDLEEIDITGDPELEARHREWLPVVEIDGRQAFVYYVDEVALLRKLGGDPRDRAKGSNP